MSHVFHRSAAALVATSARGVWVYDQTGKPYLDAAGGALVVNVGHGVPEIVEALQQAARVDYVHPTVFTTEVLETYGAELAPLVPMADPRVFPTSGGAESVETALKLARAYHLARGEPGRDLIIARQQSYHGNTLGALDASGRPPLRHPYETWLGRAVHVPAVNEYRCPNPGHPGDCAKWHAATLERAIVEAGEGRVAAFIGEAVGGATLAASLPPAGYWEEVSAVCRRHGVLVIVDEVMTGFGRSGRWFGIDHHGIQPDIMVSGKGAAGGYWPLGLCIASGAVHDAVVAGGGFIHGFTFSHSPIGASVGLAVLRKLVGEDLVSASRDRGTELLAQLVSLLGGHRQVGDVRGVGLLIGVEFVADKTSKEPIPRTERFVERLTETARGLGLLIYPSIGCANGTEGDSILLGPPFTVSFDEVATIAVMLADAIEMMG